MERPRGAKPREAALDGLYGLNGLDRLVGRPSRIVFGGTALLPILRFWQSTSEVERLNE